MLELQNRHKWQIIHNSVTVNFVFYTRWENSTIKKSFSVQIKQKWTQSLPKKF